MWTLTKSVTLDVATNSSALAILVWQCHVTSAVGANESQAHPKTKSLCVQLQVVLTELCKSLEQPSHYKNDVKFKRSLMTKLKNFDEIITRHYSIIDHNISEYV